MSAYIKVSEGDQSICDSLERVTLFDNHYYKKIRLKEDMETKSNSKITKEPVR